MGGSFWRFAVSHFTPYDANWPYGPPPGAFVPAAAPATTPQTSSPDCQGGSVIECQNQVLRETIPLAGVPSDLHYSSARVPGRSAEREIAFELIGDSVPPGLDRVEVDIQVGGQRFQQTHAPQADLSSTPVIWDGKDAYGRALQGAVGVNAEIAYVFAAQYQEPPPVEEAFGLSSGVTLAVDIQRSELTFKRQIRTTVRAWDALGQGLGGWSLTDHHVYDPKGRVLHLGDGSRRTIDAPIPRPFAGDGGTNTSSGEGVSALDAEIFDPYVDGLAVGTDGTVYFTDWRIIRAVDSEGTITTLLGETTENPASANNLARISGLAFGSDELAYVSTAQAILATPDLRFVNHAGSVVGGIDLNPNDSSRSSDNAGVAFGPDGSLYVASEHHLLSTDPNVFADVVYRVGGNGAPTIAAGGGSLAPAEGLAATSVDLTAPDEPFLPVGGFTASGLHFPVVVDDGGSLFIAEAGRILRVDPDGILRIVAGDGTPGNTGDGGPATTARVEPKALAIAPDGSLLIGEGSSTDENAPGRIRAIRPDGIIVPVIETPNLVSAIAVAPDGTVYFSSRNRVFSLEGGLPSGPENDEFTIADQDTDEVYIFDAAGRHERTEHALTGTVLRAFAYDTGNRLVSITDADGNVTTVERMGDGTPSAIVGPFGARTELDVDPSTGYLTAVTNPESETYDLTHDSQGLLETFTTPENSVPWTFTYDARGRLDLDQDPAGGQVDLERTLDEDEVVVTSESGEGVVAEKRTRFLGGGAEQRTNKDGAGLETSISIAENGLSRTTVRPDGTQIAIQAGPDPRFGLQRPVTESLTITTPARSFTRTVERTASTDPVTDDLIQEVETITVNGKQPATVSYDAATNTVTTVTPEGRTLVETLDAQGRVVESQLGSFLPVTIGYDTAGRVDFISQGTGAEERLTDFLYDDDGSQPDGLLDQLVNAEMETTRFGYDLANRLTSITRPDLSAVGFGYDDNGNVDAVTPPGKPVHAFDHTPVDLEALYDPPVVPGVANPQTVQVYDLDRQLDDVIRPDGSVVDLAYDLGRLESVTVPGRGLVDLVYEPAPTGRLASITTPEGNGLAFGYDGFLLEDRTWTGEVAGTVSQVRNDELLIATETVTPGHAIQYLYDDDDLPVFVTVQGQDLALGYDPDHGLLETTAYGQVTTAQDYTGFGELDFFEAVHAGSTLLFREDVVLRDRLGRIREVDVTIGGTTTRHSYTYDPVGRLDTVTVGGMLVADYAYDANGNRTVPSPGGPVQVDDQDRLLQLDGATYTYTDNGELLTRTDASGQTPYTYDGLGNLTRVVLPDGSVIEYGIDGRSRRIGKKVCPASCGGGTPTLVQGFLYRDGLNPVAELDGSGQLVSQFVYASRAHVPDLMIRGGVVYRILSDHLGSVRLVVNSSTGAVAQRIDYDAWGRVTLDSNPGFQPFGFAGGLYDPDTGLVRFGARDYDPTTGRWTTKDPIRFDGLDANLYAYALNDPVNLIDRTGAIADVTLSISGGVGKRGGAVSVTLTSQGDLDFGLIIGSGFGIGASLTADFGGSFGDPGASPDCPNAGNVAPPVAVSADAGTGVFGGNVSGVVSPSGVSGSVGVGLGVGAGFAAGIKVF